MLEFRDSDVFGVSLPAIFKFTCGRKIACYFYRRTSWRSLCLAVLERSLLKPNHGDLMDFTAKKSAHPLDSYFSSMVKYKVHFTATPNLIAESISSISSNYNQTELCQNAVLSGAPGCLQSGNGAAQIATRILLYNYLTLNNLWDQYDWIMLTRSNYLWLCPFNISSYQTSNQSIFVLERADSSTVSDHLIFGPSSIMRKALRTGHVIIENLAIVNIGNEKNFKEALEWAFKFSRIPLVYFKHPVVLVYTSLDNNQQNKARNGLDIMCDFPPFEVTNI